MDGTDPQERNKLDRPFATHATCDEVAHRIEDAHARGVLSWPAITAMLSGRQSAAKLSSCVATLMRHAEQAS